jgi:hypothetical protein
MRFKFLQATQVDHSRLRRSGPAPSLPRALPPPWSTCGKSISATVNQSESRIWMLTPIF